MNQTIKSILPIAAMTALLTSCAFKPTEFNTTVPLPIKYKVVGSDIEYVSQPITQWWHQFNTQELSQLLNEMIVNNKDLAVARHRISHAKALLGEQVAQQFPAINGKLNTGRRSDGLSRSPNFSDLNFTANYEVDLFDRRHTNNLSKTYQVALRHQSLRSIQLSLQAQLSTQYFDALALKKRLEITAKNLQTTEKLYDLINTKYALGGSNKIVRDQQRNVVIEQRKSHQQLTRDLTLAKRAISVLVGHEDGYNIALTESISNITLPAIAMVQPAQLVEFRPDIKMADLNLRISDTQLYLAKSKRWPTLTLSLDSSVMNIFGATENNTSLIGSLTTPIFDGGKITNQIDAAEITTSIELINYRKTVVNALQETLDTLTSYQYQQEIYQLQQQLLDNNENLYQQATIQYQAGATDFINLLNAQRSLFNAQEALILDKATLLTHIVNLYKAMGSPPENQLEPTQQPITPLSTTGVSP